MPLFEASRGPQHSDPGGKHVTVRLKQGPAAVLLLEVSDYVDIELDADECPAGDAAGIIRCILRELGGRAPPVVVDRERREAVEIDSTARRRDSNPEDSLDFSDRPLEEKKDLRETCEEIGWRNPKRAEAGKDILALRIADPDLSRRETFS